MAPWPHWAKQNRRSNITANPQPFLTHLWFSEYLALESISTMNSLESHGFLKWKVRSCCLMSDTVVKASTSIAGLAAEPKITFKFLFRHQSSTFLELLVLVMSENFLCKAALYRLSLWAFRKTHFLFWGTKVCLEIALTLLFLGGVGYHCSKRCRDSATLIAKMLSVAFLKYS